MKEDQENNVRDEIRDDEQQQETVEDYQGQSSFERFKGRFEDIGNTRAAGRFSWGVIVLILACGVALYKLITSIMFFFN